MKPALLISIIATLLSIQIGYANFIPSVTLTDDKTALYTNRIEDVFTKIFEQRSIDFLVEKFPPLHETITSILNNKSRKLSKGDIFALELIDYTILQRLDNYEDKKENPLSDTTDDTSINPNDYDEGEKTIPIGTRSGPIVRFEVVAELEDIEVEELAIIANTDELDRWVKYVYIYDTDGNLIGSDRPRDDTALFNNIFTLEKGDNHLYIALETINDDTVHIDLQFSLEIRKATGKTSNASISPITNNNEKDIVTISPAHIDMIELLDTWQHYIVDEKMYNMAKADLAIISFTPEASTDDQDIILETLSFQIQDNTVANNIVSSLQVQRIDSQSDKIGVKSIDGNMVHFDLTELDSKARVQPDTQIVLLVTFIPDLDATTYESVSIEIDSYTTDNGVITYSLEDNTHIIGTKAIGYIGSRGISD